MELYQMRYFMAVAEHESMTKAAEALHVSQPSLSKAVKGLEEEMGVPLFDRVGRSIALNMNGRIVLQAVERAVESVDAVPLALNTFVRTRSHVVNVFCPVPFGDDVTLLAAFKREHPDTVVRLCVTTDGDYDGESPDITFFSSPLQHGEKNFLLLGEESFVVSVPKGHPLDGRDSVALAELQEYPLVTVLPSRVRSTIDGMFARAGVKPKIAIEDQVCSHLNGLVAAGSGIAVLPSITWFCEEDRQKVSVLHIRDCSEKRYIYVKWPENSLLSDSAREFCTFLKGYFGRLCALYA